MERVAEGPKKNQFSANLGWVKPLAIIDSVNIEPDERIDIYANSDMKRVMSFRLEDDEFFEMFKKRLQFWRLLRLMKAVGFCNT